jgi:tetratricopeptide (TPR) repeat protein
MQILLIAFALWGLVIPSLGRAENPPSGLLSASLKALYSNDYVQSASLAARYLKAHPGSSQGLVVLARAEMAQGKVDQAYLTLQKALRANPRNIDALYYTGLLCRVLSQAQFERLLALAPESARAHQLLAESHLARQDQARAEEEYKAALNANPRLVEVLNALGELKQRQYKFEEAVEYYAQASILQPRDYDSAYGLGSCYLYLQQPTQAVEHLRRAVSIDPASAPARLALGDAYLRAGEPSEAIRELQKGVSLDSNMRQAYVLLARAYGKTGQSQEAQAALAKSAAILEKEKQAREKLYYGRGEPPAAQAAPGTEVETAK